jgi:imidazolonepropionase-like amidohydrolase
MRIWIALSVAAALSGETFLIRDVTVHPVAGPDIAATSVLVRDGLVADIAPKIAAPKGMKVIDGKGLHLYPGMIDSATTLGLAEIGAVKETNDIAEIGDFNPQLRSADCRESFQRTYPGCARLTASRRRLRFPAAA